MPKILADFHHDALFYSLQLLFEKRLGWELYRPIGMDWYHEGYWNVFPHITTAQQYLATDQAHTKYTDAEGLPWSEDALMNKNYTIQDGIFFILDPTKNKIQRGITLETFKQTKFDILLSSIPQHIEPFNKLIQLYQPQAKHIFQVGNAWGHQSGVKNILASTAPFWAPGNINVCYYHQEFDLEVFKYIPPTNRNKIFSFIHIMKNKELMNTVASYMKDYEFKSYGAGMEDHISKTVDLATKMSEGSFTWHWKPEGDGFGHTIHGSYACGRPVIIGKSHYRDKMAEPLLIDGKTCIDISNKSIEDLIYTIRKFSQPEEHNRLCENAYNRFKQVVDFDKEFETIKTFLERLQ